MLFQVGESGPSHPATYDEENRQFTPKRADNHTQVERGRDVHDGKRSPGVTAPGGIQSDQIVAAHPIGGILELFNGVVTGNLAVGGVP